MARVSNNLDASFLFGKHSPRNYCLFYHRGPSVDCDDYNFMSRSITPLSNVVTPPSVSTNNTTIIITVISVLSLTALGGFFFIKKRKEQ